MNNYPENDYRSFLEHSSKGSTWKNHKYIEIINGRYIYPATQTIKGVAGAAKTGGVRGAVGYLSTKKKQSQINKNKVAGTGSADYAASDSRKVRAQRTVRNALSRVSDAYANTKNTIKENRRQKKLENARADIRRRMAANTGSADYAASDSRKVRAQRAVRSVKSAVSNRANKARSTASSLYNRARRSLSSYKYNRTAKKANRRGRNNSKYGGGAR